MSIKDFLGTDPQVFAKQLPGLALFRRITYQTATLTLGTIPANSVIGNRYIVRTTPWDAITTFEIGKSGDTDWLVDTTQANLTGALDAGETGAVEVIQGQKVVTADTDVIMTINQGAATAGAGFVVVEYTELSR